MDEQPPEDSAAGPDATPDAGEGGAAEIQDEMEAPPEMIGAVEDEDEAVPEMIGGPEQPPDMGTAPDFQQLQEMESPGRSAPLSVLFDLDLPVAIELGRTRLSVQEVLALARGSVVQLDRQAGEPVDVYVGDKRFAEAEVVIVGEQFGVRITRLVNSGLASVAG